MKYYVLDHHKMWQWPDTEDRTDDVSEADVVFLWNDFSFPDYVQLLKHAGKKVIVFEHGYGALAEYERSTKPTLADGYLTLGKETARRMVMAGVPENEILITGNPLFDNFPAKDHKTGKGLYVALHWERDLSGYNDKMMTDIVNNYSKDYKWTIKLSNKTGFKKVFVDKWETHVDNSETFAEVKRELTNYDIVFTPKACTFSTIAKLMGIPVYVIDKEKSYRNEGEQDVYVPEHNNYLKLGDKIPKYKKNNLETEILRPSLGLEDILSWVKEL